MRPRRDDGSPRARFEGERLARHYARTRSASEFEHLVEFYRPLALVLARRYAASDRREDLEQVACVGLIKAARRFDARRGTNFRSYAIPMILGEMKRYWRDHGCALHVPRPLQEQVQRLQGAVAAHAQTTGAAPTVAHLARMLECPEEAVVDALAAEARTATVSLDALVPDSDGLALMERVGRQDSSYNRVEWSQTLGTVIPQLSALERRVVRMRFGLDMSQREISERLGIPPRRVGRLLAAALDRLSGLLAEPRAAAPV